MQHISAKSIKLFNKQVKIQHLNRTSSLKDKELYNYVHDTAAKYLCDRIEDLKFTSNWHAISSGSTLILRHLNQSKFSSLTHSSISNEAIKIARQQYVTNNNIASNNAQTANLKIPLDFITCDDEEYPLQKESFNLAMSCMNLHWVEDLVSNFKCTHNILQPNSPFIGVLLGGDTLVELRSSFQLAELERLSGLSAHCSPKTTGQDIANLLQSSGFKMVTVDIDEIRIVYPSIFELMFDLQNMGENNATNTGSRHLNKEVLLASAAIYQHLYGITNDESMQGIPATFQMIHFIGWK